MIGLMKENGFTLKRLEADDIPHKPLRIPVGEITVYTADET